MHTALVVLLFHWFELKKMISAEDAPTASLRGKDKYPRMLMVLGLTENRFDGA